jgi:predicted Zn-dependent peptidase
VQSYEISRLSTGERVISERVPSVRSVSIGFWIGSGSRDETEGRAGLSHFIEHLLFKGTAKHTAQEVAEIFDGLGGELNAATSRETTMVYARVPDDRLETALDVMIGMVYEPAFAEVDSEREVVLEEIAMVEDNPQDLVHDVVAEAVFGSHPLGRPVIGRAEVISSVGRKALQSYHRAAYAAENIVISAAGNVEHRRLVELLEQRVPETPAEIRRARKPVGRPTPPQFRFQRKATEQYHVCLGAPGISRKDERRFAASLLDSIIGAPPPRGSSRRSGRSAGWRTRSTATRRSTRTPARSGSTWARARRTSSPASRSRRRSCPTSRPGTSVRASSSARRRT